MDLKAQVVIHNTKTNDNGVAVEKVLCIKGSEFEGYLAGIVSECNGPFNPKRSDKFTYLPLLCVKDSFDTQEEFYFNTITDLPLESVLNSKGREVLVILSEDSPIKAGTNIRTAKPLVTPNASTNPETLRKTPKKKK